MNSIVTVAHHLSKNSSTLASEIVDKIISQFNFEVPKEEIQQAKTMYIEFLGYLAESLDCLEGSVPDVLLAWSKNNGERAAKSEQNISDIFIRYPDTRMVFADYITDIGLDHGLNTRDIVMIIKRVNHLLDLSINETIFAFERYTEDVLNKAHKEIIELSTPVVPIQDGYAVLPLIGSMDAERTEHLLKHVVPRIPQLKVKHLIIDFSGIKTINTEVAAHIFNIHSVLTLLGIQVLVTGIRPELASRIVSGGIDFSSISIYGNVKQAIEAFDRKIN